MGSLLRTSSRIRRALACRFFGSKAIHCCFSQGLCGGDSFADGAAVARPREPVHNSSRPADLPRGCKCGLTLYAKLDWGGSAQFWMNLRRRYELELARYEHEDEIDCEVRPMKPLRA